MILGVAMMRYFLAFRHLCEIRNSVFLEGFNNQARVESWQGRDIDTKIPLQFGTFAWFKHFTVDDFYYTKYPLTPKSPWAS